MLTQVLEVSGLAEVLLSGSKKEVVGESAEVLRTVPQAPAASTLVPTPSPQCWLQR
jgi:hypothetical protein